ncbi:MAG: outer membrane protein assembly factor BamD [Marinilabiliales bacterium]|nr:outer membrane protein assembly factor BamD [Marinilabiliales bacterium]
MIRNVLTFVSLGVMLFASSCGEYQTVVKSTDYEYKLKKAREYFDNKDFSKSSQLYGELVNIYRGTNKSDQVYYYLAKSNYGQHDYLMAGHYFRQLIKEYPHSTFAEESQYLIGYCYYLDSPTPRLDQKTTQDAIDAFQLFINIFPASPKVAEANKLIDELRERLVLKSYLNGRLYYDLADYRASVISLTNSLKEYPDSKYREELMFYLLKSKYLLGENSIDEKKRERLNSELDEYYTFVDEFPNSKFRKEADRFFANTKRMLNLKDEDLKK